MNLNGWEQVTLSLVHSWPTTWPSGGGVVVVFVVVLVVIVFVVVVFELVVSVVVVLVVVMMVVVYFFCSCMGGGFSGGHLRVKISAPQHQHLLLVLPGAALQPSGCGCEGGGGG